MRPKKYTEEERKEARKISKNKWQANNKEKIKKYRQSDEFKKIRKQWCERNKSDNKKKRAIWWIEYKKNNHEKLTNYKKEYNRKNKEKNNLQKLNWAKENKEKVLLAREKWLKNNPNYKRVPKPITKERYVKIRANAKKSYLKRQKEDPLFRVKYCLRARINKFVFKKYNASLATRDAIGIEYEGLKKHIERQFKKGMTWENHGKGDGKWNIDHIIPLSSAKTKEDVISLCHYTNLQPLWAKENLSKQDKVPKVQIKLPI